MDFFASRFSNKLPRFCSKMPDERAVAIDAFTIPWYNERCYIFPPANLTWKVLEKVVREGVCCLLVVKYKPNKDWFVRISRMASSSIMLPHLSVSNIFGLGVVFLYKAFLIHLK